MLNRVAAQKFMLQTACSLLVALLFAGMAALFLPTPAGWIMIPALVACLVRRLTCARRFMLLILFLFIALVALSFFPSLNQVFLSANILSLLIGSGIGIVCAQLIFPLDYGKKFQQNLLPLLHALINFSKVLQTRCGEIGRKEQFEAAPLMQSPLYAQMNEKKRTIQDILQVSYPEWVYDAGFNPGLRAGFRFFLLKLEEVLDYYFSIAYYLTEEEAISHHTGDYALLSPFFLSILAVNESLIQQVIESFEGKEMSLLQENFMEDIHVMENTWKQTGRASFEWLALSEEAVFLAALVRNMKDARAALLQLVSAL